MMGQQRIRRTAVACWQTVRHEAVHAWWLRRALLRAELTVRGVPHTSGGDAVSVQVGGLWFDVYAWLREDVGFTWVVDHPHADPRDEHPGDEIGRRRGFRFRVDELASMWAQCQGGDRYPPWLCDNVRR
ncbi:hypothetical protein AB0M22_44970 [Nocardia sp. NPDC051756]|uniref:hypothetical protein n=1 Tax=Nocardia sp. NPDC051756 TaxID=3154751 RepID=UPI00344A0C84